MRNLSLRATPWLGFSTQIGRLVWGTAGLTHLYKAFQFFLIQIVVQDQRKTTETEGKLTEMLLPFSILANFPTTSFSATNLDCFTFNQK